MTEDKSTTKKDEDSTETLREFSNRILQAMTKNLNKNVLKEQEEEAKNTPPTDEDSTE